MNLNKLRITALLLATLIFVIACGAPSSATPTEIVEESNAVETNATEVAPPVDISADNSSIQHTNIPVNLPEKQSGQAGDFNSSKILETGATIGGDRFTFGRFERPFNADTMDVYYPEIDIVDTEVFQDDLWIYGRISIQDLSSGNASKYAVELDTNLDGNADWLIVADKPATSEWTVNGVHVYQDTNQDIGGEFPMLTDQASTISDGFETAIFNQGTGANPDAAWVRISPTDPNVVEVAINRSAISNPTRYLINYWAGHEIDPIKFDLNDSFTHEQAGAADKGLTNYYPIKGVAEIDNSCRMAVGFQPTGKEPGLCESFNPTIQNEPILDPSGSSPACIEIPCPGGWWEPAKCACDYVK